MVSVVDGVLHHFGKPGGFHLLVTILLCCNFFPIAFHHMNNIFYASDISHTCRLPEGWPWHKKFSIPKATSHGQVGYDECRMYVDPNSDKLGTKPCVYGWEFYPQGREWTIVAEWGLVCEREYLVTLAAVVYHGGIMFGGLVFGTLADKFGRKPLMLFTLYVQTAISIGIYFVQNFILFVILRFVHGLLLQGLQCSTICLVMELLPMRYRTAAGMGCSIFWAIGLISLSLISYSVQHWRYIQLAISLPCLVTFLYLWLIPESVRWLITVTKTESALITARKFEQFNKRPLSENFSKDVEMATGHITSNIGQVESYGMRELLLQGSKLRVSCLVQCFCWFSTSSLYHALTTKLLEVGSNRYTGTIIIGAVDLVAFVVMYFLLVRFGRKRPICVLLVLCGAVCISTIVAENLDKKDGLEVYVVSTVLALVERSCVAACLSGLTICATELFPTVVRTFGIGLCLFCGEVGWIAAPQILKLSQYTLRSLPWIIFGVLTLLGGLLVLLLPETLTMPLPDTLEDTESFESRKAPVKAKEQQASVSSNPYANDWKTSYRQKIEEANGNLGLYENAEDAKEGAEKKWYHPNYSQKSGKVVRFYGLDTCEDPCQEVKTNKKQRIRMVRFSFDNEFCNITKSPPVEMCRKFSVIPEEPEVDSTVLEDTREYLSNNINYCDLTDKEAMHHEDFQGIECESSFQEEKFHITDLVQSNSVEQKAARFTVERILEDDVSQCVCQTLDGQQIEEDRTTLPIGSVSEPSESVESEAEESEPSEVIAQCAQDCDVERSQVATTGDDAQMVSNPPSRFVVKRVQDCDSSLEESQCTVVESPDVSEDPNPSRFFVKRVEDSDAEACQRPIAESVDKLEDPKPSRFSVRRVEDCDAEACQPPIAESVDVSVGPKPSRFTVQRVKDCDAEGCQPSIAKSVAVPVDSKPSRFIVQRVQDSDADLEGSQHPLVENPNVSVESKPSRFIVQRVHDCEAELSQVDTIENPDPSPHTSAETDGQSRFVVKVSEPEVVETCPQVLAANDCNISDSAEIVEPRVIPQWDSNSEVIIGTTNHSDVTSNSRFVVQRVLESVLIGKDSQEVNNDDRGVRSENEHVAVPNIPAKDRVADVFKMNSRFRVEPVSESSLPSKNASTEILPKKQQQQQFEEKSCSIGGQKKSRFIVQKVKEPQDPVVTDRDNRLKNRLEDGVNDVQSHRVSSPGTQTEKKSRFLVRRVPELKPEHVSSQCQLGVAVVDKVQNNNVDRNHNHVERVSRFVVQRVSDDVLQDVDNLGKHCNNNDVCIDQTDNGYRPFSREECDNFQNWQVLLKNDVNSSLSSNEGGLKSNSTKDCAETNVDETRLLQCDIVSCS